MTRRPGFDSHQSHVIFSAYFAMLCSLLRLTCRNMAARLGLDLIFRRNGLILHQNGFPIIINDDFLEEGEGHSRWLYLKHSLWVYIQSLTTASGRSRFSSVVKHWIIDPAARVRFSPKSCDFFQPNFMLCSLLRLSCLKNIKRCPYDIREKRSL